MDTQVQLGHGKNSKLNQNASFCAQRENASRNIAKELLLFNQSLRMASLRMVCVGISIPRMRLSLQEYQCADLPKAALYIQE